MGISSGVFKTQRKVFGLHFSVKALTVCIAFAVASPLFATERQFRGESWEVGFERYQPVAPQENANFSGLVINYFFDPHVYLGTNQMSLYLRGVSDYRPDFHLGILLPFTEHLSAEAVVGVDFYTALIVALAVIDKDDSIDYKFATNFYSPYFTLSFGLRLALDGFSLKLITQTQLGGYLQKETNAFNASLWLGLGATYRFAF
jgi:hypothetical protein